MGTKKPDAPDFYWYQKLRELKQEAGEFSEQYQFWAGLIGGSDYQQCLDIDAFCKLGPPYEIEWTLENLINYGTVAVLDSYCQALVYRRFCDGEF